VVACGKEIEWLKKMRNGNLDVPFKMIIVPHEPKEEIIKKLQAEFGTNPSYLAKWI
jgi:hypothetical protein